MFAFDKRTTAQCLTAPIYPNVELMVKGCGHGPIGRKRVDKAYAKADAVRSTKNGAYYSVGAPRPEFNIPSRGAVK